MATAKGVGGGEGREGGRRRQSPLSGLKERTAHLGKVVFTLTFFCYCLLEDTSSLRFSFDFQVLLTFPFFLDYTCGH